MNKYRDLDVTEEHRGLLNETLVIWTKIHKGGNDEEKCPFCEKYGNKDCKGCPAKDNTDFTCCRELGNFRSANVYDWKTSRGLRYKRKRSTRAIIGTLKQALKKLNEKEVKHE
jgi:hypothetical protein